MFFFPFRTAAAAASKSATGYSRRILPGTAPDPDCTGTLFIFFVLPPPSFSFTHSLFPLLPLLPLLLLLPPLLPFAVPSSFTPQYAGFQDLVAAYGRKGLEVLFFPCNQFGSQEPGSNADVKGFASKQGFKGVMMAKVDVNGASAEPLFQFMKQKQGGLLTSDIKWNFSKFLVDREGNVVGRYASTSTPESLRKDIEKYL